MRTQQYLVQVLEEAGTLPPDWAATVRAVDRGMFIPDKTQDLDRFTDAAGWAAAVYSDTPLVTQYDDGAPEGPGMPTSSSSKPSAMLEILALAHIQPGDKVFEIGTATGYMAAWLCQQLGDEQVTTVEFDGDLYREGRQNLRLAGYSPTVLHGDGLKGSPDRAPFHKVIATCSLEAIPGTLLGQVKDGGRIVAPFGNAFHSYSYVTLDVSGGRGIGRFSGNPDFMWARQQRNRHAAISDVYHAEKGEEGTTHISPYDIHHQGDAEFWIGLHVPGVWGQLHGGGDEAPDEATYWLLANDRKSWATVEFTAGAEEFVTEQYGPRKLWTEVENACTSWQRLGRPGRDQFGMTASETGGVVWRGEPGNVVAKVW
ncbi:rRNA adenine N-6-methyltransferase family protein [Streptomyces sp. NBC_01408]|uniref:rRNA adenine N-6-methyltransferase family protein n=1 Tax=Streptomyces sp. NBC_01408 TaxID=2903855 RepID=UPI0022599ABF|nr:rRNA adenine N-6-methyltransferase family protein [Streptomyces sp. NBC_01408]MCX4691049.1 protein-L-isoaspartate(D-aspartate) O-methyltransferase [Streptomyces sp. NBC_01408]